MAKIKESTVRTRLSKKISRKGVHAKTKSSKSKNSELYKKLYKGQGK
jgi:hypothetical protein